MLTKIVVLLFLMGLLWLMYRIIRTNPNLFSREALNQSFRTMGILALILIVVVGFAVLILRQSY